MRDSRGIVYSSTLHGFILILLIFGLPHFLHPPMDAEPESISVDILPIAPLSNVKPQDRTPDKQEKKPVAEKATEKKAAPETKKEEVKPEEKPEIVSARQLTKKEKKKPEKKKPVEKKKSDDLASVLKSVENTARAEESKKPTQQKTTPDAHEAKSQTYDASQPLAMSEKDAIVSQIERCWSPPIGAKNAQNLIITLHVEVGQDGSVLKAELAQDQGRYNSDSFFQAAADSAIRAVHECSPLKNLPGDKYGTWRDMELSFNPHDMLN
jgi:outer membrane biosynthesis protein TonB